MRFFGNGDPTLAAKPGFHDQTPSGVGGVAVPLRHTLDIVPELFEDFTENPLAGSSVQLKAASRVMINKAGCLAAEAAQGPMIELMGGQFDLDGERKLEVAQEPLVQSGVEIAHASFHGAVVSRVTRRAVEWEHAVALEDFIDLVAV